MRALGTIAVIANPAGGGGRVGRYREATRRLIESALGPVRVFETERAGHASELARRAIESGMDTILSLGGDGTHHEVLQAVARASTCEPVRRVAFGPLPAGSGNDFCRMLEGGSSLNERVLALHYGASAIDIVRARYVNDHGTRREAFVLNVASAGLSGEVDISVAKHKKLGGVLGFFVATIETLSTLQPGRVRLEIDGRDEAEARPFVVAACNGQFAGGRMMFGPHARLADGLLDVICVEARPLWRALPLVPALYGGRLAEKRGVRAFRCRRLRIEPATEFAARVDLDGESPGTIPLELEVLPRAVDVLGVKASVL